MLFRSKNKGPQYLVHWEDCKSTDATWEKEQNVLNAPLALREFHMRNKDKHPGPLAAAVLAAMTVATRSWNPQTQEMTDHQSNRPLLIALPTENNLVPQQRLLDVRRRRAFTRPRRRGYASRP